MSQANAISNVKTQGATKVYDPSDATGLDLTAAGSAQTALPLPPNKWAKGRDPYANDGMVGQDFFKNQA